MFPYFGPGLSGGEIVVFLGFVVLVLLLLGIIRLFKNLKSKNKVFKVLSVGFLIVFFISCITFAWQMFVLRNELNVFSKVNNYYQGLWGGSGVILLFIGIVEGISLFSKKK